MLRSIPRVPLRVQEYWDQVAHELRLVYAPATEAEAKTRFKEFAESLAGPTRRSKWLWDNAWSEVVPFLDYATWRSARSSSQSAVGG
jgi:transposase-like protein